MIRRSAIGLDRTGRCSSTALGEAVTAQALARAMHAVGAEDAAQLDVNYSYPRFLFFDKTRAATRRASAAALIPGIKYQTPSTPAAAELRDFFYLTRRRPSS